MSAGLRGDNPKDDLLVSWKDIAAYLKCSVRKAQRLERRELPVNRIPGTKSVWALKPEIDRWLRLQAESAKRLPGQCAGAGAPQVTIASLSFPGGLRRLSFFSGRLWVLGMLAGIWLGLTMVAATASAYGLTIVFFVVTVVFLTLMCPRLPDTSYTRGVVGLFMIAGMAYGASATNLPDVIDSVINMRTLQPALAYPFVTGVRFIPIPALISVFLVVLGFRHDMGFARNPRLRWAYLLLGVLFLLVTAIAGLGTSGAHRIWQAGLSIRWTLLAGESFVMGLNFALFVMGYRFYNTTSIKNYHQLLSWCGIGYLLIALTAAIVDSHWNEIDKYYLDTRRPPAYRVQNTNAANDLRDWLRHHTAEAGPDLMSLSNDPEFLRALQTQEFYKQNFDDAVQVSSKAVIFGYKSARNSPDKRPVFVRIRFPAGLAAALRFEVAGAY